MMTEQATCRSTGLDRSIADQIAVDKAARGNTGPARYRTMTDAPRQHQATSKQLDMIDSLLRSRQHNYPAKSVAGNLKTWTGGRALTREQASKTIAFLLAQPLVTRQDDARHTWADLATTLLGPDGEPRRYAIDDVTGDHTVFWKIAKRTSARTGREYVALFQVIGGQPDTFYRGTFADMLSVAQRIAKAGPREAMLRYGREIGECGHCGRHLTNQDSREAGIGPVCASKM